MGSWPQGQSRPHPLHSAHQQPDSRRPTGAPRSLALTPGCPGFGHTKQYEVKLNRVHPDRQDGRRTDNRQHIQGWPPHIRGERRGNGLTTDLQSRCRGRGSVSPAERANLTRLVFWPRELAAYLETPSSWVHVAPGGSAAGPCLCSGPRASLLGARASLQRPRI